MTQNKTVVLFTGRAQSGKDTSCDYIINKLTRNFSKKNKEYYTDKDIDVDLISYNKFKKYSFAQKLKQFCHEVFDIDYNLLNGTNEDKNNLTHLKWADLPFSWNKIGLLQEQMRQFDATYLTVRQILQILGTDICRHMYNDCWARATLKNIISSFSTISFLCDARFPNEIDVFSHAEKTGVINRLVVIHLLRNPLQLNHKSETALNDYPYHELTNYYEIDNENMSQEEKNRELDGIMVKEGWINS